jgi:hypothetical protein
LFLSGIRGSLFERGETRLGLSLGLWLANFWIRFLSPFPGGSGGGHESVAGIRCVSYLLLLTRVLDTLRVPVLV